jgi:hypothetical protein
MNLYLTAHAAMRMSQRGLAKDHVELIRWIGTEVEGGYLDFQALDRALKHLRDQARKLVGKRLVLEGDRVITAYHAARSKQRVLLQDTHA